MLSQWVTFCFRQHRNLTVAVMWICIHRCVYVLSCEIAWIAATQQSLKFRKYNQLIFFSHFFFFLRKWSQIVMKLNHMMNGELASFQVGRRLCTYVKVGNSWVSVVYNVANWVEFLIAGVPTKHGGAGRVLIKFGNTASSSRFTVYTECMQVILMHMDWIWDLFWQTIPEWFFWWLWGWGEQLICWISYIRASGTDVWQMKP